MEIMVSEKGADGLLNIPVKGLELWIEELKDGRLAINLGDPDDPKLTCIEVQVEHGDLVEETIKARDVKCAILGEIPDMGKARFVRMRGSVREVEVEEGGDKRWRRESRLRGSLRSRMRVGDRQRRSRMMVAGKGSTSSGP